MTAKAGATKTNAGTFTGYVINGDTQVWSQGGYDTKSEALNAAKKQLAKLKKLKFV